MVAVRLSPLETRGLASVQKEFRSAPVGKTKAQIKRMRKDQRLVWHNGLRLLADVEAGQLIAYFAFSPHFFASREDAAESPGKHLYVVPIGKGYRAMLNPSLALQEAGYMGVYVNTKTYGTGSPNSSMTAPRAVKRPFMIGDQEVGFVATLLCGSTSLKRQDFLRFSYGPEYASELAAATTEYFETRDPQLANLKAGGCLPPVLRKAKKMKEAIEVANRRATRIAKEVARKAAKAPSTRVLPGRPYRAMLKRQRWQ